MFDRGGSIPLLPVPWLHTLKDLAELVSDLVELVVHLLTQSVMALLKPANLLLKAINPFIVGVLGDVTTRIRILLRTINSAFGLLAFALALSCNFVGCRHQKDFKSLLIHFTENFVIGGTASKNNVQAQTPALLNDLVGIHGALVAWWTAETISLARISEGQPRLSMFTLGIIALLIEQILSSCGNNKSLAVARASVANREVLSSGQNLGMMDKSWAPKYS